MTNKQQLHGVVVFVLFFVSTLGITAENAHKDSAFRS
jgi:hypothetical protein